MCKRLLPFALPRIELCQRVETSRAPRIVPDGFIESCIGLFWPVHIAQGKPEIVVSLAVVGIAIPACKRGDRGSKMPFCILNLAPPKAPQSQRIVCARISRMAAQGFVPVGLR